MTKAHKLTRAHINRAYHDSDGYWIELRRGFKWAGDAVGCVHAIHEDTREEACSEMVMRCECKECNAQEVLP